MKHLIPISIAVLILIFPVMGVRAEENGRVEGFSSNAGTGLTNSVHNLMSENTFIHSYLEELDPRLNKKCVFCHTPRFADEMRSPDILDVPLWSYRTASTFFVPYGRGLEKKESQIRPRFAARTFAIGSVSRLCLSCHDGTIAQSIYGNDMRNLRHHRIGINVDTAYRLNNEIADPDTTYFGVRTVRECLYECEAGTQSLIECPTCHSVHNMENTGEHLLFISDRNSNVCLTCHLKGSNAPLRH